MNTSFRSILTVISTVALFASGFAQKNHYSSDRKIFEADRKDTVVSLKKNEELSIHVLRDGKTSTKKFDPLEQTKIIVEFKEAPIFHQGKVKIFPYSFYEARFTKFSSDMNRLTQQAASVRKSLVAQPEVRRKFYKTFFGMSLTIPKMLINDILSLPYVKKVHEDKQMRAFINDAVHIVRADSVRQKFNTEGDSIVVGIIDTGIDYLHPALGGHFGPSYKVIGGYDCYNNDNDPFDDNGHGTHVAGIVAADGDSIKGIAPKAKLMAFKVLNEGGYGDESTVIEGIERAVDPNDDGNSIDKVDIANMSLGNSNGTPDDAVSTAVNNAVSMGVIFCVAAGNDYSFRTIGSPGSAVLAITVGATDKSDAIANFSSKGPTRKTHAIKPDILAPGVDILSTFSDGTYESHSGTSMASPVVTGICALLKSIDKGITPAKVKSMLMSTAVSIGKEVMIQGTGRVDAFAAALRTAYSIPSQLSYGLDSSHLAQWTRTDTMWIFNTAQQQQTFTTSMTQPQSGVTVVSSPQQFTLDANDSQMVLIGLTVDNGAVPYPQQGSLAYDGVLSFDGTKDTIKIPWAFVKAARVIASFNGSVYDLVFSSNNYSLNEGAVELLEPGVYQIIAPQGTYRALAEYYYGTSHKFVFKENIVVEGVTHISFDPSEAVYTVGANFVDHEGDALDFTSKELIIGFPDSSVFRAWGISFGGEVMDTLYFSTASNDFTFLTSQFSTDSKQNRFYNPQYVFHGISSDIIASNTPSDYFVQPITVNLPPDAHKHMMRYNLIQWMVVRMSGSYGGFGFSNETIEIDNTKPWEASVYLTHGSNDYLSALSFEITRNGEPPYYFENRDTWLRTPIFRILNDSIVCSFDYNPAFNTSPLPSGKEKVFYRSPVFSDGYHLNNYLGKSNIIATPYFFGSSNENRSYRQAFLKIMNNTNEIIFDDTLYNMEPIDVPPGIYHTAVTYHDYYVGGGNAVGTLSSSYDLREFDPNPPIITSFKLFNSEKENVDSFHKNEAGMLSFSAIDFEIAYSEMGLPYIHYKPLSDQTQAWYKLHDSDSWIPLSLNVAAIDTADGDPYGIFYSADLSGTTLHDSSAVDLKARFADESGNITEWKLEPAFAIGNYVGVLGVEEIFTDKTVPLVYSLKQNFPNPFNPTTKIEFAIPAAGLVQLKIYDILGREVKTLVNEVKNAGRYSALFNASALSSGIYFYTLRTNNFTSTKKMLLVK